MMRRGFSLIEVLFALAIFATAGLAVMRTVTEHIRAVAWLEDMTFASYVAANQLVLLQLETSWPPSEQSRGEVEMANRTWLWQQQVSQVADDDLRQVVVKVSLTEQPEDVVYQLTTFIGRPHAN
ncbi:type II secretion system minor pseudopilin GspI [Alkalimonas delamerensis]|uniref:Type II secretion system protein I n=1 Tax=Alkalimonas delamerensis TaxID=265981 RepID=A0ABT9GTQ0_9GAMM|nr:type II secretion system minor pseudopilin GspI [Alkalimonas delamerensis]MDP4530348.1 type II secretion system minor pseudopilin GspI [Alkalimonas delamerensis]